MHKFAFVLNKKVAIGSLLNAVGHMGAALAAGADDITRKSMFFLDYQDGDQNAHWVSGLPLIVLKADNANQLRTAREKAKAAGLHFVDFTESMTEGSYESQMARTATLKESELDYWGLALFGETEIVNGITKKFSLYQ